MAAYERRITSGRKCGVTSSGIIERSDDSLWNVVTQTGFNVAERGWILVQADDGVLWGRVENGQPVFPNGGATISPTSTTAWSVRVFNDKAELLLWKDDATWRWRVLSDDGVADADTKWTEWIEERMMLYGTRAVGQENGFATMYEGSEGLVHTVPLKLAEPGKEKPFNRTANNQPEPYHPLRLVVRHYLEEDTDTGMVKIVASRLVRLVKEEHDDAAS
jgi:CRISPR-associated protein (TIGR03984 family)